MACFIVVAAEAVVVTAVAQGMKHSEKKKQEAVKTENENKALQIIEESSVNIPWSRKLMWLAYMLWGGVALLAFEHVWHGEVTLWFPFLTAASGPEELANMFREMGTVGVTMTALVTAVWVGLVTVVTSMTKRMGNVAKAINK